MNLEIERRFIVKGDGWKSFSQELQELKQGYLSTNFEEWVVRIRIINETKSILTIKGLEGLMTNHEFEYHIPIQDALAMWGRISKKLHKKRYCLNLWPGKWVVDCFEDKNFPLVLAEVELNSEEEFIKKPHWCSHEVTGLKKFSNAGLAQLPISDWSTKELQSFNIK